MTALADAWETRGGAGRDRRLPREAPAALGGRLTPAQAAAGRRTAAVVHPDTAAGNR